MMFGIAQLNGLSDWLDQIAQSTGWLIPEITLAITLFLLLLFDLVFNAKKEVGLVAIAYAGIAFTFVILINQWVQFEETITFFNQMLKLSNLALLMKMVFLVAAAVVLFMLTQERNIGGSVMISSSEHLIMIFTVLIGSFFMTMTVNLILIYLGIELVSIASYVITALNINKQRAEAGLKYLIYGAVASALMLYGMSWLYGLTGTLQLDSISFYAGLSEVSPLTLGIALILTLTGFLFKLGAFPLHVWSPDVYEAAPTPVVSLFSVVPKLAALTIIWRVTTFLANYWDWASTLAVIAIASMFVGNLSALWQSDAKRMLAYSSIAHAGFLLLGIISQSETGNEAFMFYALTYALMNLGAFALVQYFELQTGTTNIKDWKGLGKFYPFHAILLLVVMIALTGLPPTVGFNAKLYVFSALWRAIKLMVKTSYCGFLSLGCSIL
jgi:NADH-quinone oxidoreductase subunit N